MQRHSGVFEPEARLWVVWIATPFMVGGLIFLGFCFELRLHWVAIAFAWGIYCFGTVCLANKNKLHLVNTED